MDLFKELKLKTLKTDPDVWISRVVIYERITPDPSITREVLLSKGLNIVWAEETEDDDPSAEITGHSAGKTTFCRFLRYILGEKTYGTRANMELIQKAFPHGYVAGELYVKTKKWAVLRPIGNGRSSYVKPDSTLEELLKDRSRPVYADSYIEEIGLEEVLSQLETADIVRTGEAIQWSHILAWSTRDQEARFQNIYDWRSPRSESETPVFRFPKSGPLFVMRTALGLFLPDELKSEEKLAKLQRDHERLNKELEKYKKEPEFWVTHYNAELRNSIRQILPNEDHVETMPLHSGNLFPDLDKLSATATEKLEKEIAALEHDVKQKQTIIDDLGAKIRQHENELSTLDKLFSLEQAGEQQLGEAVTKRQTGLNLLKDREDSTCLFGDILYRDCKYYQDRQRVFEIVKVRDAKVMESASAKRAEAQQHLEKQKQQIRTTIYNLSSDQQKLLQVRQKSTDKIAEKQAMQRDLNKALSGLKGWIMKRDQPGAYKELDDYRTNIDKTAGAIKQLDEQLTKLLKEHNESRDLLASIFSGLVKAVLASGTYDGQVSLDNRELAFSITHGPAMSGEAVETLSVLLTDITALIYNIVSAKSHLPGFLMHDSPREADLGVRIYRSFIRFIAELGKSFGSPDNCPFQYILTTTTAPPKELQKKKYVKLTLNANKPTGLLLGRNIATLAVDINPPLL